MRPLHIFLSLLAIACSPAQIGPPPEPGRDAGPPETRDAGPERDATQMLPARPDGGAEVDSGPEGASDAGESGDAGEPDAAPAPAVSCGGVAAAGYSLCAEGGDACELVFYDGAGCAAACARVGLTCTASFRDDDDEAPLCARHPSGEAFGCAATGHMSDYCVCGPGEPPSPPSDVAFEGAEGFGAQSEGGAGGQILTVTNLDDSGSGSLRWAVERSGRRIVRFAVSGVIQLRSALSIRDPYLTVDGRTALDPGEQGITIRDYPIDIRTHDVVLRYLRVRLGDWAVLRRNDLDNRSRPANSRDLDCVNIHQARDVILDHMSMSWSADEIVSVTNSRNITIQWSILSEPLGDRALHPYGDDHAFAANNSAATLTYHHNLFAHYRFRGPQFEANDMQNSNPRFDARFEAVNNLVYGYTSSGSRYITGFERDQDRVTSVDFGYHFVGNEYIGSSSRSEIHANTAYGRASNISVYLRGNIGPHRSNDSMPETAVVFTDTGADDPLSRDSGARNQVSSTPLFSVPVPVTVESAQDARSAVLARAGCSLQRDATDRRVVEDARQNRSGRTLSSQDEVADGWPSYER